MARNNNKINLPTNTTDIRTMAKYLKYIDARGIVSKDIEQKVFAEVKIQESRKNVTQPARDTHTKSTLKLFGLIDVAEDDSFAVSTLGKEVLNYYLNEGSYNEEERIALMLKVLCRWEINDKYGRHIHPGFILMKLLCDTDLNYYITNHELSHFTMSPNFKFDSQYNEIKQYILQFRSQKLAYDEDWKKSKSDIFLSTFETNWGLLTRTSRTDVLNDRDYRKLLAQWEANANPDSNEDEDDVEEEAQEEAATIDDKTFVVNECRLNGLAAYVARLYLSLLEGVQVRDYLSYFTSSIKKNNTMNAIQQIYFGAPGTGKSHEIKKQVKKHKSFRITFHPDTDYSSFVGAYKPTSVEVPMLTTLGDKAIPMKDVDGNPLSENKIIYTYVKQAFLNAYIEAWKEQENETPKPVFLVIEEINRGNCAQIFGDIFQLLDRNDAGFSDYSIVPDSDLSRHVSKDLKDLNIANREKINAIYEDCEADMVGKVLRGDVLLLPNNLYIWATMNTSDQSLFPIDSAFKRRWDWKYIKIADAHKGWQIKIGTKSYDWWQFVQAINHFVFDATQSEDKSLGYFFAKAKDDAITAETFVSKVIFYLYTDVFKDYGFSGDIFKGVNSEEMTFQSFYNADGSANESQIARFIENVIYSDSLPEELKAVADTEETTEEQDNDTEEAEATNAE